MGLWCANRNAHMEVNMSNKVADLLVTGEGRLRYPWWQMQPGDHFDATTLSPLQMNGLRNTLSAAIAGIRKRTGMDFMQRSISERTIRVFRIDGHVFGLGGVSRSLAYSGEDPLNLTTAQAGATLRFVVETEAEMNYMVDAAKRSADFSAQDRKRRRWEPTRIDIKPDLEAMTLWIYVVEARDVQGD